MLSVGFPDKRVKSPPQEAQDLMSKVERFIKDLMTDPHPDTPRCLCLQRMPTDVPFLSLHYHGQEAMVWTSVVGVDSG